MKKAIIALLAGLACGMAHGVEGEAVYADVETDAGTFTIELDAAGNPEGVLAFAGLTEGWLDWLDPRTGTMRTGVRYMEETAMDWVQREEADEVLLLGNRGYAGAGGSGLQLRDGIPGGPEERVRLAVRSVAMINSDGPDTLDGTWAIFLKDGEPYYGGRWGRIGTVVSNWAAVETMAAGETDGNNTLKSPFTVRRVSLRGPDGWEDALKTGLTNLPSFGRGRVKELTVSGTNGTVTCTADGMSRWALVHTTNMTGESRVIWVDINEDEGTRDTPLDFQAAEEGTMPFGERRFFSVSELTYPELGGPTVGGGHIWLETAWEWGDGSVDKYLHRLDTGEVYHEDGSGTWTNEATILAAGFWQRGVYSGMLVMREQKLDGGLGVTQEYWYTLGEEEPGRFRMSVFVGPPVGTLEVWGHYRWVGVPQETTGKAAGEKGTVRWTLPKTPGPDGGTEWQGIPAASATRIR